MKIMTANIEIQKRSLWTDILKHRTYYLFLLPSIIYIFIFKYIPMYGLQIAFKDFNGALGIWGSKWVGLQHFANFIEGYYFWPVIRNTLEIAVYSTVIGFPFPIILALMLNEVGSHKYQKFMQTVLYAPHFISTVVMAGIIIIMLSPTAGIVNFAIENLGFEKQYFMIQPEAFKHIYVWSGVWQEMGWGAIIYLAALSAVNQELHEAATIDGANRIQRIWHINLPTIKPTIVILLILSIGSIVNVGFEKAFLLQNDLNLQASEVISTYVYRRGLISGNYSFASAVGLFNSIINGILLIIVNLIARRVNETSLF